MQTAMTSRFRFNLPPHERLLLPRKHWLPEHKRELLVALEANMIALDEVWEHHKISTAELAQWRERYERYGLGGLRAGAYQPKARAA